MLEGEVTVLHKYVGLYRFLPCPCLMSQLLSAVDVILVHPGRADGSMEVQMMSLHKRSCC